MAEQMSTPSSHPGFEALSATEAYVLGTDGALWLETGPWGPVPPSRQQVDGNVAAFQPLSAEPNSDNVRVAGGVAASAAYLVRGRERDAR